MTSGVTGAVLDSAGAGTALTTFTILAGAVVVTGGGGGGCTAGSGAGVVANVDGAAMLACARDRDARRDTLSSATISSTNSLTRQVSREGLETQAVAKGTAVVSIVAAMTTKAGLARYSG